MAFDQIKVELLDSMGTDRDIANAAWTSSYDLSRKTSRNDDDVAKLVQRLVRDGHTTPLESIVFRFWCRWPIFVDRQHMTHRIQSANGLSGRYRTLPSDYYELPEDVCNVLKAVGEEQFIADYDKLVKDQITWYNRALNYLRLKEQMGRMTNGAYKRCREVLRGAIGTANMTERVFVMNLHAYANYMRLRSSEHAQPEIKDAADKMLVAITKADVAPVAIAALKTRGWKTQ